MSFDGYKEASVVDEQINQLLNVHGPITAQNTGEFLKYARTISTSCFVIEAEALMKLGKVRIP